MRYILGTQWSLLNSFCPKLLCFEQILDKNSEQFWNDVKMKFLSKEKQDRLNMFEDVYSKYQSCQFYIETSSNSRIKESVSIILKCWMTGNVCRGSN